MTALADIRTPGVLVTSALNQTQLATGNADTRASYLLDSNPDAVNDPSQSYTTRPTLPVGTWISYNGVGLKLLTMTSEGATITFDPNYDTGQLPTTTPDPVHTPSFAGYATNRGTSSITWIPGREQGVTFSVRMLGGTPLPQTTPATITTTKLQFNDHVSWRPSACTPSGCILGPVNTVQTTPPPVTLTAALGTLGNGQGTITITRTTSPTLKGWSLYWCNTRIAGPGCNPYVDPTHGNTTLRTGNATIAVSLITQRFTQGTTAITSHLGTGVYRLGDTYNIGVQVTRRSDGISTRGFITPNNSLARNWSTWKF
jgi:hypothetical protein